MLVLVLPDADTVSRQAAALVAGTVERNPDMVLGLATGASPLGMYSDLADRHQRGRLDFSRLTTINLDDYVGLAANHPASCRSYMRQALFDHVNLRPDQTLIPDGRAEANLMACCAAYEQAIADCGGIDLQVLGIGLNGHLGFNEPGSGLDSRTRIVRLSHTTRTANRRSFAGEDVPEAAITMGLGTIRAAHRLLLLATGSNKAEAIAAALEGPITASVPASVLQLHGDALILLDEAAASGLSRRDHYAEEIKTVRQFTPQQFVNIFD